MGAPLSPLSSRLWQVEEGMNKVREVVITNTTPNGGAALPFVIPSEAECRLVGSGHFRPKARLVEHFRDCIAETGRFYVENRLLPPSAEAD
jgi:hypothetical protein